MKFTIFNVRDFIYNIIISFITIILKKIEKYNKKLKSINIYDIFSVLDNYYHFIS
jgi:hypothetical protein